VMVRLAQAAGHRQRMGRPFVTLSYAQSLDGCITDRPGQPLALSSEEAMRLTHQLRAAHDAILVGIGAVLADNPRLTVRLAQGRNPQPVVVDSHLRFPLEANLITQSARPPWIATTDQADQEKQLALEAAGARILRLSANADGRVSLPALLTRLGELGINSLMVEGGARLITSFLAEQLVDGLVLTIAPTFVGGLHAVGDLDQARPGHSEARRAERNASLSHKTETLRHSTAQGDAFGSSTLSRTKSFPRLRDIHHQQLGDNLIVWGDVV
jgi:GTP cyclohydrolase II